MVKLGVSTRVFFRGVWYGEEFSLVGVGVEGRWVGEFRLSNSRVSCGTD